MVDSTNMVDNMAVTFKVSCVTLANTEVLVTILVLWNSLLAVWPEIPFSSFTFVFLCQHCGNEREMHACVSGGCFLSPSLQLSKLCPFYVNLKERGIYFRNSCNVIIRGVYERSLCFLTVLWQSRSSTQLFCTTFTLVQSFW
jgi:hypothetical protein